MEKKRKIDSECRKFKDQWNIQYFVIESSNKALCLICNESIAVLKEYNMKRHYETKHSQNYSKYTGIVRTEKFEALKRGLKSQQSLFTKVKTEQEAATRASFRVALEIAKRGKPFTDGEMIKECIIAVVEEMCPEKVNLLKTVSMSANTVARRVENIAENISSQLFDKNGHVEWFSLALDESTDVSDTAQVLIYIRGVDKSYEVHEELLDMYSIHGTTTGTDIFKGVEMAINKKNLRWKNLKCITTDGGKNMSGKDKGVVALVSKAVENDGGSKPLVLHCIIHQQSLCGKCLDMSDVLKPVISTVNFIRSFGLNHRQFRQFIAEIGETDLPYHTAVRWLSCGKVLQRFFELRAVIEIFLNEKHRPLTELQNNAWLWKLAFYVDLTKHVNELNLRLQGENQHLPDLYTNIKSFRMKLILFQSQLRSKCFSHFKTCEIFSHTTETEFPIDFAIETLSALKINFDTRFSDFDAIANQIKIFQNPFDADIETLAPELQMEMIDLQCSDIIKNKYENSSLMVETRSGKMQDTSEERIKAEESAKPQLGATIGGDASSDPVVLNPNIDIPKYDGTEDPRPWIESLEEIGFLYHWADYIISRYAALNMIGGAKTWLNLHKISFTSWENFKSRLIEDFASDANKEEMKMRLNRMQQWNEPAIRFAEDILVLCNKVDPQMEEETKIKWVIGGLKKEYSFSLHLNPPKNTNELLEICKKLDLFEKNYQERAEKSRALYIGPRSPRPHHQEQWKNATSFRRPYQNTSKPQAPAPRYYQNTSKPQAPTPRYYQNKPLPQVSAPRRSYTPNPEPKPVYPSKTYNKNPNSNRNRTEDGRPICFKCNKPGHVARYCRVKFVRIVEEDPSVSQDKSQENLQMDERKDYTRPRLYADVCNDTQTNIPTRNRYSVASIEAEDGEYVIEENNKMTQTNGLRLARSLLTVTDKKTHIWITNPYPRPLKIMKDQTLAYGSLPAEVNFIENIDKQNENDEIQFQMNKYLSFKEQERLKQILAKYTDLFSSRLGRTNLAKHQIHTEDAKPIKHKPYRVSAKERTIIKDQIDEMLEEGIIRPSSSPWSFPVILVKKRDGKYRFCVDYRKLNEVTVKDVYPIPRIDDVMDSLQGSKYFSAIDLKSGYWQVEIEERDKEKTAFTTAHGLYEFNVMPFGLCNAPATFERNMENMLGNLRWQICLCYLDDVIIYSPDFPTHLKRLEPVYPVREWIRPAAGRQSKYPPTNQGRVGDTAMPSRQEKKLRGSLPKMTSGNFVHLP
ncbi:EPM2AIP1 [Cordylochernes scorpioides]|uniref:EPM2AIP1 n=1 Tax=Cordylochernes scorpioides TaxID=51811 RepID=A0ABY6KRD8_9ARAC|nr:EPM2AIP1 [Cordylochernes scorpioides]